MPEWTKIQSEPKSGDFLLTNTYKPHDWAKDSECVWKRRKNQLTHQNVLYN